MYVYGNIILVQLGYLILIACCAGPLDKQNSKAMEAHKTFIKLDFAAFIMRLMEVMKPYQLFLQ